MQLRHRFVAQTAEWSVETGSQSFHDKSKNLAEHQSVETFSEGTNAFLTKQGGRLEASFLTEQELS